MRITTNSRRWEEDDPFAENPDNPDYIKPSGTVAPKKMITKKLGRDLEDIEDDLTQRRINPNDNVQSLYKRASRPYSNIKKRLFPHLSNSVELFEEHNRLEEERQERKRKQINAKTITEGSEHTDKKRDENPSDDDNAMRKSKKFRQVEEVNYRGMFLFFSFVCMYSVTNRYRQTEVNQIYS